MSLWDWLFGSKKDTDYGSTAPIAPARGPAAPPPLPTTAAPAPGAPQMQQLQLTAPAAVPTSYGIQRAIELMRALPVDDDPALVLRVVRKTLRSTGVSLEEIVDTAREREAAVVRGIESDRAAIEQLEIQIATRKANITRLEGDLEETREVRARIEEALQSETKIGNVIPPEEIIRIRAEAAQKSKPPPIPGAGPLPKMSSPPIAGSKPPPKLPSALSPSAPKRETPAAPKIAAPKPEPKPEAKPEPKAEAKSEPKPEAKSEPKDEPKAEAKTADPKIESKSDVAADDKVEGGRSGPMSSIPDLGEIDDGFEETATTREIEVPVVRGKTTE